MLELAFKDETAGLVSRADFILKRDTIAARLEEDALRQKRKAEDATLQVTCGLLVLLEWSVASLCCTGHRTGPSDLDSGCTMLHPCPHKPSGPCHSVAWLAIHSRQPYT